MSEIKRPEKGLTIEEVRAELISLSGTATSAAADLKTLFRIQAAAAIYSAILKTYELELFYYQGMGSSSRVNDFIGEDEAEVRPRKTVV